MFTKQQLRRWYFHFTHHYLTLQNVVMVVGAILAIGWAWGSVQAMERNYRLQRQVDQKLQEEELLKIASRRESLAAEYYKSEEYQEMEVKRRLNLALPGETVVILPENTAEATKRGEKANTTGVVPAKKQSNFEQWMNFLFGGNAKSLQDK